MADELAQIAEWRANVAELVTNCCDRWELRVGEACIPSAAAGHVLQVGRADGMPAVLKLFWRHHEAGDAAMDCIRELAPTQGEQMLVHQDLHGENVLAWTIAQAMAWSEGNETSLETVRCLPEEA